MAIKVKCIESHGLQYVTLGREYVVAWSRNEQICIYNDIQKMQVLDMHHFGNRELYTNEGVFDKENKILSFSSNGVFPAYLEVRSSHTGKLVVFARDDAAAEANEFWDGELYEYKPVGRLPNLQTVILHCGDANPVAVFDRIFEFD